MSTRLMTKVDDETRSRLEKLAERGYSLSDLIKMCVDKGLPLVEEFLNEEVLAE